MNDNKEMEAFDIQQQLEYNLVNGINSVLFKRISRDIEIDEQLISNGFNRFTKEVELGESFTLMDLIVSAENVINGGQPDENAENMVYVYDYSFKLPKRISSKLLKNSYNGIYSLFSVHNGVSLDLDAVGGNLKSAETKRFLVMPSKKCNALISKCQKYGMSFVLAGRILQSNKIIITQNNGIVASIDKALLESDVNTLKIDSSSVEAFLSGYRSVCSLVLCDRINSNNLIRFAVGGRMEDAFARTLGYYCGMMFLKPVASRMVFINDTHSTVAVPRPKISDGDYLYLLKLRNDAFGLPDKSHYGQLFYYLTEKKKSGIIKDVLPIRENIQSVIERLCSDDCNYVKLSEIPDGCFGIIVSVARGESVNGMKLGYFINN